MRISIPAFLALFAALLAAPQAQARKAAPDEFPLRVHIFAHNGVSHYRDHMLTSVDGEGRANLYENGMPTAFDFSYLCSGRLVNSIGYETYLARWKKPGREIEVLLPEAGSPDHVDSCKLQVVLKTGMAYYKHDGQLGEAPSEVFQKWMLKHDYDPEHGKNLPVRPEQPETPEPPAH